VRLPHKAALAVLVPLVVIGGLLIGRALRPDDGRSGIEIASAADVTTFEHDYTIPHGTNDRIVAGETVKIVPQVLTVHVGESIRIVNDDDVGHVVGVFYVGAGETTTQRFTAPGELTDTCTVHSGGEFTLRVEP
jgi:plastocyanin